MGNSLPDCLFKAPISKLSIRVVIRVAHPLNGFWEIRILCFFWNLPYCFNNDIVLSQIISNLILFSIKLPVAGNSAPTNITSVHLSLLRPQALAQAGQCSAGWTVGTSHSRSRGLLALSGHATRLHALCRHYAASPSLHYQPRGSFFRLKVPI